MILSWEWRRAGLSGTKAFWDRIQIPYGSYEGRDVRMDKAKQTVPRTQGKKYGKPVVLALLEKIPEGWFC